MSIAIQGVMKTSAIGAGKLSQVAPGLQTTSPVTIPSPKPIERVLPGFDLTPPTIPAQDLKAAGISPQLRELLLYQSRMGQFGLRVELVGKCSEATSASVRRLEQGQG
jgi:hypothetical protein